MPEITSKSNITAKDALDFHKNGNLKNYKLVLLKPATARDLSLAYSPGSRSLFGNEKTRSPYDYTAKGNMVAIISNGTAVLGLGNQEHLHLNQ